MNKQELFNKAVTGLASQGFKRSMNDSVGGFCNYRNRAGMRCAVGWLIEDKDYNPDYDDPERNGCSGITSVPDYQDALGAESPDDITFLVDLQYAHDVADDEQETSQDSMQYKLTRVAKKHNLVLPPELQGFVLEEAAA